MKPHTFNPFHPISIIAILKNFILACEKNGVHKGVATCLFHFFINKTAFASLKACLSAGDTNTSYCGLASSEARYFTTWPQVLNFSLKKFATNEFIAETESEITRFT